MGPFSQLHGQSLCIMKLYLELPYLSPNTSGALEYTWGAGDLDVNPLLANTECQGDVLLCYCSNRNPFSTSKNDQV